MPRRPRTTFEQAFSIEQSTDHRRRLSTTFRRVIDFETYQRRLKSLINEVYRQAIELGGYSEAEIRKINVRLAEVEEKVFREIEEFILSQRIDLITHFFLGFALGFRGYVYLYTTSLLERIYAEAIIRMRYKIAWSWRGFLVQAMLDRLYNVLVNEDVRVLEVIKDAVRFANRYVELLEGIEGKTISLAHEYLSCLRRRRCHISAIMIKVTPVTMRLLESEKGNLYTAIHMSGKTIAYNPYTKAAILRPVWFAIVNRRKGYVDRFSMKLFGTYDIIALDTKLTTARDFKDDTYLARTIAEIILRPYVVMKDRARGLGFPEKRFDIEHCSLYCIVRRKTRGYKLSKLPTSIRLYDKRKVYLRTRIL